MNSSISHGYLRQVDTETASFRFWTHVADSISKDDYRYAKRVSNWVLALSVELRICWLYPLLKSKTP